MLRVALPETALMVTGYVPAGVPVVVVTGAAEWHPGKNKSSAKSPARSRPMSARRRREVLPPSPTPSKDRPETGSQVA